MSMSLSAITAAATALVHNNTNDHVFAAGDTNCGTGGGADSFFGLRVASVFIILIGSSFGAFFPVMAKRSTWLHVPKAIFDFAKYFGSGVIIATGFIHLLSPALDALGSDCLSDAWKTYPYALALCLFSIFAIFIVELIAFRWGTAKLAKIGKHHDAHGHAYGGHAAHGPEGNLVGTVKRTTKDEVASIADAEGVGIDGAAAGHGHDHDHHHHQGNAFADQAMAQIIGVAILEFGVALHSILIGLTLAVDENFKILFVVLCFHQTFEGLGIGTRLAHMELPSRYNWVPFAGAVLYGLTTPIGIAVGLGVRTLYNPDSTTASIVSGVLDSLSSGILIYTGLVELLAHEFLFNREMMESSNAKLAYALGSMCLGCGLMALLGRWA
ncbi:ZIP-like iron-zinc transporter [Macrolepiota fuliginosa MF-IS2]|uniref:ZIP-like iron-zinc transporter n=1 Tax=Macrolepiota fuliginosa MF-IS2 TaxID=1400762 RepID=A0A9P6C573_9AGAR|nr:ZIP-like iron-zinc transporter [Macrolepiota fuliginosa MF-IS2]KAF9449094.1 ZIP-like iron-zinc transporter [Macrolepiota fuliginosa MF-IS2]